MKTQRLFKENNDCIVCANPSWLNEHFRKEHPDGTLEYEFTFTKAERKVFRKQKPIRPSEWAERNRVVTMSSMPGSWRNETTPYLVGIMDAAAYSFVREISVCKGPQSGVSEAVHNIVGYSIDRNPGPVLYVYPDQLTAKENSQDRILPMIKSSIRLRDYLTGYQDDESAYRINLQHMPIYLGWGSSAARLANKPIMIGVADEVDKPGFDAKKDDKETSPMNLIRKRFTTFKNRYKFLKLSTPTVESGNIWVEFKNAQVIFDYFVICPDCGHRQKMIFDQIVWPGRSKADPKEIETEKLARYKCEGCECLWDDSKRDTAVRMGTWQSRDKNIELHKHLEAFRPQNIAFHLPGWVSRFVSLSESAASFLRGLTDLNEMKDFLNAHKAEPYIPKIKDRSEASILKLQDERPAGMVPGGGVVAGLVAGVDTQDHGFWFEIRAFGYGLDKSSWGIRSGYVETWDTLEKVLWGSSYQDKDGNEYFVHLAVQDAMGHRTGEVYDFCRKHPGMILPLKGEQNMAQPHSYTNIEFYPGTKKPIPGGQKLLRVNVNYYKNILARLLNIVPGDPGAWQLHADYPAEFARQMTVEYINEKGFWECPEKKDNHLWDCSGYALAAADVLGIWHWKKPEPVKTKKQQTETSENPFTGSSSYWG